MLIFNGKLTYFERVMNNPIIETDLAQILNKLDGRFDKLDDKLAKIDERLNHLEVGQARLEEKVSSLNSQTIEIKNSAKTIEGEQKNLASEIADLKGAKSLVVPILIAVITSILTLLIRSIPIK